MTIAHPPSIRAIMDEYWAWNNYADLYSWAVIALGRPMTQMDWNGYRQYAPQPPHLSEFTGLNWIPPDKVYDVWFPSYPTYSTLDYAFATDYGTFYFSASSHEHGGNNTQYLYLGSNVIDGNQSPSYGTLPWNKFKYCHIPWMGYYFYKATWDANYWGISWGGGNFGGGTMKFYFEGE